jgi:hypothetical protein
MIMMKHLTIAAMALCCIGIASARAQTTGSVAGRVVDEKGAPVAYATVRIEGTKLGAYTKADGSFLIRKIPAGEYAVKATGVGYHPLTREKVRVTVDGTTAVRFTLVALTEKERGPVRLPESDRSLIGPGTRITIESVLRADSLGLLLRTVPQRRERTTETSIRIDGITIDTVATDSTGLRREP